MRDEIFAKQLMVLKREGDTRKSVLESQKLGNSTGRYTPVMTHTYTHTHLPSMERSNTRTQTSGTEVHGTTRYNSTRPHTFGTLSEEKRGKEEYRQYDSRRVREGVANQAIADYYDSVQNKLFGMPHIV